jgi:3-oxoacyl-[acyl-carrier protein] reductase
MDLGIAGRRAAVAAASQGLGFAVADALAREGAQVAICSRRKDAITDAAARIGREAVPIVADVGNVGGAVGFVRDAIDALGGIDILVTNAGGPPTGTFATIDVGDYMEAFDLNCRGAIAMCKETVPAMQSRGWGRVLAITSIAVRQPIANLILSNTARAALTAFLKTLAREVARDGVTVNSLEPGLHATERLTQLHGGGDPSDVASGIPTGTLGDPSDFGAFAAFLCSAPARFVTGTAIPVDGGAYSGLL